MEAVSREELAAKRAAKKAAFNTEYDAGVAPPHGLCQMSSLSWWFFSENGVPIPRWV